MQGEYLGKLAFELGFDAAKVWNDPQNADLRGKRDPNVLCPGDVLYVPDARPAWLSFSAGTTNRFRGRVPTVDVTLTFNVWDRAMAGEPCIVEGLGAPRELSTDGEGRLKVAVPVTVAELFVKFPKRGTTHHVLVGHMDPIDQPSGVAKRLAHLDYRRRSDGEDLAPAIRRFQAAQGLPVTGVLDDATKKALLAAHGG